jgi:hypothetical protein
MPSGYQPITNILCSTNDRFITLENAWDRKMESNISIHTKQTFANCSCSANNCMASEQLEPISVYLGPSIDRLFSIHAHNFKQMNEMKALEIDLFTRSQSCSNNLNWRFCSKRFFFWCHSWKHRSFAERRLSMTWKKTSRYLFPVIIKIFLLERFFLLHRNNPMDTFVVGEI